MFKKNYIPWNKGLNAVFCKDCGKKLSRKNYKFCNLCKGMHFSKNKNFNFKGGKHIDDRGYIQILMPEHPNAKSGSYIREHRLIAEKILGRFLKKSEVIHHIDNNKQNNLPKNLFYFRHNVAHRRFEDFCKRHNLDKSKLLNSNLKFYGAYV